MVADGDAPNPIPLLKVQLRYPVPDPTVLLLGDVPSPVIAVPGGLKILLFLVQFSHKFHRL